MTLPALGRIRDHFKNSSITVLTDSKLADLWRCFPAVNSVLTFDRTDGVRSVAKRIREQRFDAGLALPNSWRSAAELWWASIPRRFGYRKDGREILLTDAVPRTDFATSATRKRSVREIRQLAASHNPTAPEEDSKTLHHVLHYLHLAGKLGANPRSLEVRLSVPEDAQLAVLNRIGIDPASRPVLFGINPGAEYGPAKRWPAERFVAAAHEIQKRTKCCWIIFGSGNDIQIAKQIEAGLIRLACSRGPAAETSLNRIAVNLAGATSLAELLAGLKLCHLLLTNDSGSMHCAAAVGTAVVAIFGSTSPELTSPGLIGGDATRVLRSRVPCTPCFRRVCPIDSRCMNSIEVSAVVEAAMDAFREVLVRTGLL